MGKSYEFPDKVQKFPGRLLEIPGKVQKFPGKPSEFTGKVQKPRAKSLKLPDKPYFNNGVDINYGFKINSTNDTRGN